MSSESTRPTPLGVARSRFLEGLTRKSAEVRAMLALLVASPSHDRPREELRRRLHALYASAQVFQLEALASALRDAIARLDAAREGGLLAADLDALASLAATLPLLGVGPDSAEPAPLAAPPPPRSLYPALAPPPPLALPLELESSPLAAEGEEIARPELPPPSSPPRSFPSAPAAPRPESGPPMRSADLRGALSGTLLGPRSAPLRSAPPVLGILVVAGPVVEDAVREALAGERFEVVGAEDAVAAVRAAEEGAPDVVLAERALLAADPELAVRLRGDPLADPPPLVVLAEPDQLAAARELGAAVVEALPVAAGRLAQTLARLGEGRAALGPGGLGGALSLEELAARVAAEVKRGLVDASDQGGELVVPVGGAEILAATWAAIGRMRSHLEARSGGRLHFRERGSGPSLIALAEAGPSAEEPSRVRLEGRRVLVADDDPAVVWFFAGILREAGCLVDEASDGAAALRLARACRPDVIVSDILMPELDGFALLRELEREPPLCDVPVVLLSWKEDFLQRMRELRSGASGYLRKEAGAPQILAAVRDALRPRARLEERLRDGGEVRGPLARIGPLALLETVARFRPDARLTVRDAASLFEIDLRGGQLVDLTRTAADGSFRRGADAVPALLGVRSGRYGVATATGLVRGTVKEPLEGLLARSTRRLQASVRAVTGDRLARAHRLELDADLAASHARSVPPELGEILGWLAEGHGPAALLAERRATPEALERVLVELARQGGVTSVRDAGGERLDGESAGDVHDTTRAASEEEPSAPRPAAPSEGADAARTELPTPASREVAERAAEPAEAAAPTDPAPDEPAASPRSAADSGASAARDAAPRPALGVASPPDEPPSGAPAGASGEAGSADPDDGEPEAAASEPPGAEEVPRTSTPPSPEPDDAGESPALASARSPLPTLLGMGVLFAVGYLGYQALGVGVGEVPRGPIVAAARPAPVDAPASPAPLVAAVLRDAGEPGGRTTAASGPARAFGEELCDPPAGEDGAGQGVLLFEPGAPGRARVTRSDGSTVRDVRLGEELRVVVPAGIYGVAFDAAGATVVRFTRVAPGCTRRLPRP
jgi:CheY-like chemotaxis protein